MRHDLTRYPRDLQQCLRHRMRLNTGQDIVSSLKQGGLESEVIHHVIFSHQHYDYIGGPSDCQRPRTKFIVAPDSLGLL
ncbi:uncharacterized protein A1O9_01870, partial [Exophiala aquamarina CBS 119918]